MARLTGLEPATSGVTGRHSNRLSYNRAIATGRGGPGPAPFRSADRGRQAVCGAVPDPSPACRRRAEVLPSVGQPGRARCLTTGSGRGRSRRPRRPTRPTRWRGSGRGSGCRPGVIYLDGNSLGPAPEAALAAVAQAAEREWAGDLIESWNKAGWFALPERLGDLVASIVGADPGRGRGLRHDLAQPLQGAARGPEPPAGAAGDRRRGRQLPDRPLRRRGRAWRAGRRCGCGSRGSTGRSSRG